MKVIVIQPINQRPADPLWLKKRECVDKGFKQVLESVVKANQDISERGEVMTMDKTVERITKPVFILSVLYIVGHLVVAAFRFCV
jgi:hypothetical protein